MASISPFGYMDSDPGENAFKAFDNFEMVDRAKQLASTHLAYNDLKNEISELTGDVQRSIQDVYQKGQESVALSGGINQLVDTGIGLIGGMKFGNNSTPVTDAYKGLEGFGPLSDGNAYGQYLDATQGTSGIGPFANGDVYGSFLQRN